MDSLPTPVTDLDQSHTRTDNEHSVQAARATARAPRLSVVIPAYGRVASLSNALEALCAQTLPPSEYEVIVSDDGSPEPLAPSIAHFAERMTLRVVRDRNGGPAEARNRGARQARAPIIAFTDDDCVPAPDWLEKLSDRFRQSPGHLVGGRMENTLPHDRYATATQLVMSGVYDYYRRFPTAQRFFSTTNLAVPADRFWVVGGFAEEFGHLAGEDYDFCSRWQLAGFPSVYAPEARVGHAHGHNLLSFWRQHFGYGRGLLRVRQMAARRRGRRGVELEAPSFYTELLTYPLREKAVSAPRRLLNAGLVLLSQVATVVGAGRELLFGRELAAQEPDTLRLQPAASAQGDAAFRAQRRTSHTPRSGPHKSAASAQLSTLTQQADRGTTDSR